MEHFARTIILAALSLLLFAGTAAHAQPQPKQWPPKVANQQAVFDQLPDDMKEEILADAQYAVNLCEKHDTFSIFQDCECIGMKIIDARIAEGPDMPTNNLIFKVGSLCTNKPAILGHYYDNCQAELTRHKNVTTAEKKEFCLCVGKEVADAYALKPYNSVRYKSKLSVSAHMKCGFSEFVNRDAQEYELRRAAKKNMLP